MIYLPIYLKTKTQFAFFHIIYWSCFTLVSTDTAHFFFSWLHSVHADGCTTPDLIVLFDRYFACWLLYMLLHWASLFIYLIEIFRACYGLVAKLCLILATLWTVACQSPLSMGFFQASILEWVAISFSRKSSWPSDRTCVFCTAGGFF